MARDDGWNDLALGNRTLVHGADAAAQELGSPIVVILAGKWKRRSLPLARWLERLQYEDFNKRSC